MGLSGKPLDENGYISSGAFICIFKETAGIDVE
jgi:hypothetical protein